MPAADRIKPTDSAITTFLDNLRKGEYQIPTFQREVVWNRDHVKKLWDSIYRFYPVGSILVWKTDLRLHRHRAIGGHELSKGETQDRYQYILDGQQRTTALLTSLYGGKIEGRDGFDPRLYFDITIEREADPEDESYKQRFLFWSEIDDGGKEPHPNNARKRRFEEGYIVAIHRLANDFGSVEGRIADMHPGYDEPERVRLRELKQVLDTYRIAFIELQGIKIAEVCQIFERVNQAGQPLNIVDIVVAKTYEQPSEVCPAANSRADEGFYLRELLEEFRASIPESAYAHIDDLTLVQAAAAIERENVKGTKVKNITDRYLNELTSDELRGVWPGTAKALRKTFDLFENHLNIKGPALVPFRYLYMATAVYFYRNDEPDYDFLKRYFWYVAFHNDRVLRSTSMLWNQIDRVLRESRHSSVELDRFVIDRERIKSASYTAKGRYSRAILSLFASLEPRDWEYPDRKVIVDVYYQLTDRPNLHHIFPLGYTAGMEGAGWVNRNSLMNIAYLTQITNLKIGKQNPIKYVRDLKGFGTSDDVDRLCRSHLLPDSLLEWSGDGTLPDAALATFVDQRTELVIEDLRRKVRDVPMQVIDSGEGDDDEDE